MNSGDDPLPPWHNPSSGSPPEGTGKSSEELPDYEEEVPGPPPPSSEGLSNPKTWRGLFICLALLLGMLLAAPIYHSLKSWRANALLEKAQTAFAYGDNALGVSFLKQAMALAPGNEAVGLAVELFNARMGDPASLKRMLSRMEMGTSSVEELLGLAELEGKKSHNEIVLAAIAKLPKKLTDQQLLRLILIQALLKYQETGALAASAICLDATRFTHGDDLLRLQTQAAVYLLSGGNSESKKEGLKLLLEVMGKKTAVSLEAARILAQFALYSDKKTDVSLTTEEVLDVAHLLPKLPGHLQSDELMAADLEIQADPAAKTDLIKRLTESYQHAPRAVMLDFARWLNGKGLHDDTIAFAGPDRPQSDTDWLLIVLDAECAKGDWEKIPDMLETPAGLGIPDAVKHLFLARVAMMSGRASVAEEEWRSVNGSLHLEKPETLAYIAGYEEQLGAYDQAVVTYREMADRKETHLPGLIGLIRVQSRTADPNILIPLYEEIVAAAPDYSDAAGDLAYLKLLNDRDLPKAAETADKLLAAQPDSLARISVAALGRLKNGNVDSALSLYETNHIDWMTAPAPWKAVYVAVLRASGNIANADQMNASINSLSLSPREKTLLNYPTPNPVPAPPRKQK